MASLNAQGIISAVAIALYAPIFFFASWMCLRYGVREKAWLFLLTFSLIRIVGGALSVSAESIVPAVTELYIGGYALEAPGPSPLLLSALGLIEIVTEGEHFLVFSILHIVGIIALVLTIVGLSSSGSTGADIERRVGGLLFAVLYIVLVAVTVHQWINRYGLMKFRKQLLGAVAKSLPMLTVLTSTSVLYAFSSRGSKFVTQDLSWTFKFNMFIMEYQVVLIYVWAGTRAMSRFKDQDSELQASDDYPLYPLLVDSPLGPGKWFCC